MAKVWCGHDLRTEAWLAKFAFRATTEGLNIRRLFSTYKEQKIQSDPP